MAASLLSSFTRCTPLIAAPRIFNVVFEGNRPFFIQSYLERARRGTRERKLKELKKRKAMKAALQLKEGPKVPYSKKKNVNKSDNMFQRRISDDDRVISPDNIWFDDMFKFRVLSFEEAIHSLKEVFHPTIYNNPSAPVNAYIELDMTTDKKTKFHEGFINVVPVNYPFQNNENRSVLAFCKLKEQMDEVTEAGATLAGGSDTIKSIKRGKIMLPDFQFVIAHPNILSDLVNIRGLLRKKFPTLENGKLSTNLPQLVQNLQSGIKYEAKRDDFELNFGWVDVTIGKLDMEIAHLEDNFSKIIDDIKKQGPRRTKNNENYRFISRCFIMSPLHHEKFKIPVEEYIGEEDVVSSDDEDEEENQTSQ